MSRGRLTHAGAAFTWPACSGEGSVTSVTSATGKFRAPHHGMRLLQVSRRGLPSTNGIRGAGRYLNYLIAHLRRAQPLVDVCRDTAALTAGAINDWNRECIAARVHCKCIPSERAMRESDVTCDVHFRNEIIVLRGGSLGTNARNALPNVGVGSSLSS